MKEVIITLNRAHKISQRLTQHINEKNSQLSMLLSSVKIRVKSEFIRIEKNLEKAKATEEMLLQLQQAQLSLRLAIAAKNMEVGIHAKLSLHQELLRQRKLKQQLLDTLSSHLVIAQPPSTALEVLARNSASTTINDVFVTVQVADEAKVEEIESAIQALNFKLDQVSDEINSLNNHTITIEFTPEVAVLAGISA
ncbi:hypothetical protein ACI2KR_07985 [Pseudomonas luteola]